MSPFMLPDPVHMRRVRLHGRTEGDAGDISSRPLEREVGRADRGQASAQAVPCHRDVEGVHTTCIPHCMISRARGDPDQVLPECHETDGI